MAQRFTGGLNMWVPPHPYGSSEVPLGPIPALLGPILGGRARGPTLESRIANAPQRKAAGHGLNTQIAAWLSYTPENYPYPPLALKSSLAQTTPPRPHEK